MVINFLEDYLKIDGDISLSFFYVAIKIMFKRSLMGWFYNELRINAKVYLKMSVNINRKSKSQQWGEVKQNYKKIEVLLTNQVIWSVTL